MLILHPHTDNFLHLLHHFSMLLWYRCCCSVAQFCPALCDPMDYSTSGFQSFTFSRSLLKPMSIESMTLSNHLVLCHPLLLPSVFPSIRVFSSETVLCIRWPKDWRFSFIINPSNEYSGLISFEIDWFDLLAVQGTLKILLQHHSSKASILHAQLSSQSNSHIHTWPLEKP